MNKEYEKPIVILHLFELDIITGSAPTDGATEDPYDGIWEGVN